MPLPHLKSVLKIILMRLSLILLKIGTLSFPVCSISYFPIIYEYHVEHIYFTDLLIAYLPKSECNHHDGMDIYIYKLFTSVFFSAIAPVPIMHGT